MIISVRTGHVKTPDRTGAVCFDDGASNRRALRQTDINIKAMDTITRDTLAAYFFPFFGFEVGAFFSGVDFPCAAADVFCSPAGCCLF